MVAVVFDGDQLPRDLVDRRVTAPPTLALTPDEELSILFRALPKALGAASLSRRREDEAKLAELVARIKKIERID